VAWKPNDRSEPRYSFVASTACSELPDRKPATRPKRTPGSFGTSTARAKITTVVHGQTVEAHLAQWTGDPDVVIFWFHPDAVPNSAVLSPLIAYDANGKRLTK
jgi:hypothetical protein